MVGPAACYRLLAVLVNGEMIPGVRRIRPFAEWSPQMPRIATPPPRIYPMTTSVYLPHGPGLPGTAAGERTFSDFIVASGRSRSLSRGGPVAGKRLWIRKPQHNDNGRWQRLAATPMTSSTARRTAIRTRPFPPGTRGWRGSYPANQIPCHHGNTGAMPGDAGTPALRGHR